MTDAVPAPNRTGSLSSASPGRGALYRMARELAARVIERHRRRLGRRITSDLDPTDDLTHGAQQG